MALLDWKSVFTLALIVLLGWYLFTTSSGKKYLGAIGSNLGGLLSGLKLPEILGGQANVETGNTTMRLSVQGGLFGGKSFDVKGSNFYGTGMCDLNVTSSINIKSQNVSIDIIEGSVGLASSGDRMSVNIRGTSSGFKISDENKIFPTDKGFDINVNCLSSDFTVTNILENQIMLGNATGNVAGDKGTLKLTNDTVEVDGFKGSLQISGGAANLNGAILKILLNGEKAII